MTNESGIQSLLDFDEGNRTYKNTYIEDSNITNAELVKGSLTIKSNSGEITRIKTGMVEKRIMNKLIIKIQQNSIGYDRKAVEIEAENQINEDLKKKNITTISQEVYDIAVAAKVREIMKVQVENEFKIPRKKFFELAETTENNYQYLDQILKSLSSKDSYRLNEKYVDENYEIREKKLNVQFFPTTGEDISITSNSDEDDNILIKINEDIIPYLIVPNKNSYTNGYVIVENAAELLDLFTFQHTDVLYKTILQVKNNWRNQKFTFKELQSRFGTRYGVKKKFTSEYKKIIEESKKYLIDELNIDNNAKDFNKKLESRIKELLKNNKVEKFEKSRLGDYIHEVDKNGDLIYEDDFYKSYRFFKREVLQPAIDEINSDKTLYTVVLEEERGKNNRIEKIYFQVTKKVNTKLYEKIKYSSLGYFVATQLQLSKLEKKQEPIKYLDSFAETIQETILSGKFNFSDYNIDNLEMLEEKVKNNYNAINKIVKILSSNTPTLSHLQFDTKLLIVFDIKNKQKHYSFSRIGNDAEECLKVLVDNYPNEVKEALNKINNSDNKKIEDFLTFEFKKLNDEWITINKDNIDAHRIDIDISLKNSLKRNFKSFKNKDVKKEFFERFLGE